MKGLKRFGLGLIAAAAVVFAIGAVLLASSQVSAQDESISVSDGNAAPGAEDSVEVAALNIPSPGLGAWTIDIAYDATVLTALSCAPEHGAVCNTTFAIGVIRVSGASAGGVAGDSTLATIIFRCEIEDTSSLTPTINVLADATIGDPQDIDASTESGTFTCAVPVPTNTPEATDTPILPPHPTATTVVTGPPDVGTGIGSDGGSSLGWLIAALAGVGLAAVAGFGALRLRARQS